jgi:ribosomal protein S20
MPVTKTAKRALRGSQRKAIVNSLIISNLEAAIRQAKTKKTKEAVRKAVSLADRATKKKVFHKNKAARIKSALSKITSKK